ncbi:MAG: glycoside hydrolase family 3 C-terminal domain-containing protein [Candidatus Marinimicrobia bacterium]|nr:glycoside hydrolase family 3 C-terminal domain-containing protein [Candidatus Neomarinimicrobiota bacterium]
MKFISKFLFTLTLVITVVLGQHLKDVEIEAKVNELLHQMTFAEKVGQMTQFSGTNKRYEQMIREGKIGSLLNVIGAEVNNRIQKIAVEESRLGIPLVIGLDVIHGYRTIFPIPLAASASWDTVLIRKAAEIAAKEAASAGIHWTFAPMVDIARDPRWGRIAEGAGEDPFLGSAMTRAQVLGFQGKSLADPLTLLACGKHFVAYGGAEGGRDYNTVDISERTLREIYLPPFKAAVDAGVGTLMSAFNEISGVPTSANQFTLRKILKGEWGFDGFVVSDWNSIGELVAHGIAKDRLEAGVKGLTAGVDMDMEGRCYTTDMEALVADGTLSDGLIEDAVRRILRMKFKLGLFEHPYIDENLQKKLILHQDHIQTALELARESIVLLKNEKDVLPLNRKELNTIALIGPLADDKDAPLGTWRCQGKQEDVVTVYEGLKNKFGDDVKIIYAKGCDVKNNSRSEFNKAIKAARKADVVVMVMGESADMSGEAASRADLNLPGVQAELINAIAETNKPIVLVLMNGRPITLSNIESKVTAIVESWHLGIQHGNAVANVLTGDYNPSGKLTVTFPRSVGQIPIYYNHKSSGRPNNPSDKFTSKYIDLPSSPLYPFGYGLSYTEFRYTGIEVENNRLLSTDELVVSVNVKNTGKRGGDEVVQLYIRDMVGSVTRPVKELKGFQRVALEAGEQKTVQFQIPVRNLGAYDLDMNYTVEPGEFGIMVGGNSVNVLTTTVEVVRLK